MTSAPASTTRLAPPANVGSFRLRGEARRVEPAGIFDYMDGGGELYLGYGFDHLDVYEYASSASGEDALLVEIYWLSAADDAYGLLSQDWGGEALALAADWPAGERRALYGAGLLRIWSDNVFVRVMASLETPASRAAVLAIGRGLVAGRALPPAPALVRALPGEVAGRWQARLDRHVYLRSHLVLNSAFFLATANLLELGPGVEAVIAPYDDRQAKDQARRTWLLLVRYASTDAARRALAHFVSAYLPAATAAPQGQAHIEDGWTAWRLDERSLTIVFAAAEPGAGQQFLEAVGPRSSKAAALP
jgi:hypothetical protein